MNLENFVKETLVQVIKGVEKAEKDLNPNLSGRFFQLFSNKDYLGVDFQVAVTVENQEESTKSGGASIKILEAGIGNSDKNRLENVSIIKFRVNFSNNAHLVK